MSIVCHSAETKLSNKTYNTQFITLTEVLTLSKE